MKKKKIVVIGGGTGLSVLLRGLKEKDFDITAIVTVGDDGGSSGRLREDLKVPPPGDVRNVIVALSDTEPLMEQLFQYRFTQGEGLKGHSVGNLFLAAMTEITGDFTTAVKEMRRVLAVKGNVLPVTNEDIKLCATMEDGSIIIGESKIPESGKKIEKVQILPENAKATPESIKAIKEADMIVLGPGSLYTSLLPNLLFNNLSEAIKNSNAKKVYISNIMTQKGETDSFTVFDHVKVLYDHLGEDLFDIVLVNKEIIPLDIIKKYNDQGSSVVRLDKKKMDRYGFRIIHSDFVLYDGLIRHNAKKIADVLEQEMSNIFISK